MELPNIIQQFIGNSVLEPNKIGQSPSDVYSFNRNNETFFL
ncbi:APH(3') family aminoglycoside O-phosphotransferase, partial [Acinetobacter baumannii]